MDSASGDGELGTIYEPLGTPFHKITASHRGPILIVTTVPFLIVATLTTVVRLWTVYSVTRQLGLSEATIIASILFAIGYTVCLNRAVEAGLGTSGDELTESQISQLSQQYYTSNLLLILSLACAKSSLILFFIKIIGWKSMWKTGRYISQGVLLYTILWGIASLFAVSFQCSPVRWALGPDDTTTCSNQHAIQLGIRVTDVFSDIVLTILPIILIRILQTNRKSRFIIVILFGVRITTIIPTLISIPTLTPLYYLTTLPTSRSLHAITPAVWTSLWLFLSITTACIPSIKQVLADWAAGIAGAAIIEALDEGGDGGFTYGSASKSHSGAGGGGSGSRNGSVPLAQKLGFVRAGRAVVGTGGSNSHGRSGRSARNGKGTGGSRSGIAAGGGPGEGGGQRRRKGGEVKGAISRTGSGSGGESVRGLTEGVILQTTDYAVEYEYEDVEMVAMGRVGSGSGSSANGGGSGTLANSNGLRSVRTR